MKFGLKKYFKLIRIPDLASIGNLLLGFIGIIFLLKGNEIFFIKSILLAGLLDGIDGFIARKKYQNNSSRFGVEIDSLADLLSFGLAPSLFFWYKTEFIDICLIIPMLFLTASMIRLARYNISNEKNGFMGVPTTCAGLILIISLSFKFPFYNYSMIIISLILTFLMLSEFHFPKFKSKFLIPLGVLLVLVVTINGLLFHIGKIILFVMLILYLLIGPVIKWNYLLIK